MLLDPLVLPRKRDHGGRQCFHLAVDGAHVAFNTFQAKTNAGIGDLDLRQHGTR